MAVFAGSRGTGVPVGGAASGGSPPDCEWAKATKSIRTTTVRTPAIIGTTPDRLD